MVEYFSSGTKQADREEDFVEKKRKSVNSILFCALRYLSADYNLAKNGLI